MASKHFSMSNTAKAVLAIIAGILLIFWFDMAKWILGIFLIVWGILALIDR
ncbi:MAG: hypothetical protein NTV42_03245 [Chloroflexi bacterium]|jgi:uncharacterized membrane protein HdeD (DUF308 family)|nr:hypothetical protein [Chloroflexota bacterium]MCX6002535.1 hypothetical protein [Chloroflexota bacterium]